MKKTVKRYLSLLLSLTMVLSLCNFTVVSAKDTVISETTEAFVLDEVNEEQLYMIDSPDKHRGEKTYFAMDFIQPTRGTNEWDTDQTYKLSAVVKDYGAAGWPYQNFSIYINYLNVLIDSDGDGVNEHYSLRDDSSAGLRHLEMSVDPAAGTYSVKITSDTGNVNHVISDIAIPKGSLVNWASTGVSHFGVMKTGSKEGSNMTVNSAKAYYTDGNVELIEDNEEHILDTVNEEQLYMVDSPNKHQGRHTYFAMDFIKPARGTDEWDTDQTYKLSAVVKDYGAAGWPYQNLPIYINYLNVLIDSDGDGVNEHYSLRDNSSTTGLRHLEMSVDPAAGTYNVKITSDAGNVNHVISDIAIPKGSLVNWASTGVSHFGVIKTGSKEGSSMTIKAAKVYYKAEYNLSAEAVTGGTVLYNGEALSANGVDLASNTEYTVSFAAEDGYEFTGVTVNGVDKFSSVANDSLTIKVTDDTVISAVFTKKETEEPGPEEPSYNEYLNPTEAATLTNVGDKVIWNTGAPTTAGNKVTFSFEGLKPEGAADYTGVVNMNYRIFAKLAGVSEPQAIAVVNQNYLRTAANIDSIHYADLSINSAIGTNNGKYSIVFDTSANTYYIDVRRTDGGGTPLVTAAEAIPGTTAGTASVIEEITIELVSYYEGQQPTWTIGSFELTEQQGATEYINPTSAVTLSVNGDKIVKNDVTTVAGEKAKFVMEIKRPTDEATQLVKSYKISAVFTDNSTADLAWLNQNWLYTNAMTNPQGLKGSTDPLVGRLDSLQTSSEWAWGKVHIEFDMENSMYKAGVQRQYEGTMISDYDFEALPGGIDTSALGVKEIIVEAVDVNGTSWTVRNLSLKTVYDPTIYENPTGEVTLNVVGDKIILDNATAEAGKNTSLAMKFQRPTDATNDDVANSNTYTISAVLDDNGTEKTVTLAWVNQGFLYTNDKKENTHLTGRRLVDMAPGYNVYNVEFDMTAGTYTIRAESLYGVDYGAWPAVQIADITPATTKVKQIVIEKALDIEGTTWTLKDMLCFTIGEKATIEVSPTGTYSTLAQAKAVASAMHAANPGAPIDVVFAEGIYNIDETVVFSAADTGSEAAPITYKAADGANVVFKGSKALNLADFELVSDVNTLVKMPAAARGKVVAIDLTEQGISLDALALSDKLTTGAEAAELFVNNERQTIARYPNGDDKYIQFTTSSTGSTIGLTDNRIARWAEAEHAYVTGFFGHDYQAERAAVEAINTTAKTLTIDNSMLAYPVMEDSTVSRRIAINNLIEEIDVPGEYYIDRATGMLYYYPIEGIETIEVSTCGDMMQMENVEYINFDNINFEQGRAFAINMKGGLKNISITNCRFENFGKGAIWQVMYTYSPFAAGSAYEGLFIDGGHMNLTLTGNEFVNLGSSGVQVILGSRQENVASGSVIQNNLFANIGSTDKKAIALRISGVGADVSGNTIHDTGIGIDVNASKVKVHNNEIYNILSQVGDSGAIYSGRNFINRGVEIYENYIHGVRNRAPEINMSTESMTNQAIYLDDAFSGAIVRDNIIEDADMGIFINAGSGNTITGNQISNTDYAIHHHAAPGDAQKNMITAMKDLAAANENYAEFMDEINADYNDLNSVSFKIVVNNTYSDNKVVGTQITSSNISCVNDWTSGIITGNNQRTFTSNNDWSDTTAISSLTYNAADYGVDAIVIDDVILTSPANGEEVLNNSIVLAWEDVDGADEYTVTITGAESRTINTYDCEVTLTDLAAGDYTWTVTASSDSALAVADKTSAEGSFTAVATMTAEDALRTVGKEVLAAESTLYEDIRGAVNDDAWNAAIARVSSNWENVDWCGLVDSWTDAEKIDWAYDTLDLVTNSMFVLEPTKTTFANGTATIVFEGEMVAEADKIYVAGYADGKLADIKTVAYNAEGTSVELSGTIDEVKVFTWAIPKNASTQAIEGLRPIYTVETVTVK